MCTFIVAWRVFDDVPVVVAANRDEALDRPSRPPEVVDENPRIVAPVDEVAGGTWIGFNDHGVLVSVTNRWTDESLVGDRSRGVLVRDALEQPAAAGAAATVESAVEQTGYEGFNLVALDEEDGLLLEYDGTIQRTSFAPGIHVVVNVGTASRVELPHFERLPPDVAQRRREIARSQARAAERARDDLAPRSTETVDEWVARARAILRDHDYGFCVHRDGFGTRSSSIVRLPNHGRPTYEFADGPPCAEAVSYEPIELD